MNADKPVTLYLVVRAEDTRLRVLRRPSCPLDKPDRR